MQKGHFHTIFTLGSALIVLSLLGLSWVDLTGGSGGGGGSGGAGDGDAGLVWKLIGVQGIVGGLGMGLCFGSGSLVLAAWFERWVGFVGGMIAVGGAVGESISFLGLVVRASLRVWAARECRLA